MVGDIVQRKRAIEKEMRQPMPAPERAQREQTLIRRKDDLLEEINRLEAIARKIAQDARKASPETAQKFQSVANDDNLKDLIDFSKEQLSRPQPGNFEPQIIAAAEKLGQ